MTSSVHPWVTLRAALPASVRLIAVSKTFGAEAVRAAYGAGARDFGENRVQEAIEKQAALNDLDGITWHLIGHLQSNKVKKAVEIFDWIHSLDELALAQKVDRLAGELGRRPKCCLQVKLAPDADKFGWQRDRLWDELAAIDELSSLEVRGLMAIAPLGFDRAQTQALFEQVRELAAEIAARPWQRLRMEELSMGMSNDWPLAVAAGATMVRLGRTVFGDRA